MFPITLTFTAVDANQLMLISAAIATVTQGAADATSPIAATPIPEQPSPVTFSPSAETVVAQQPAPGPAPSAQADPGAAATPVTFEEVKKPLLALSNRAGGRDKCVAILTSFGVEKLSALKPEQFADAKAAIEKELAA